jgi:hypothetical protein
METMSSVSACRICWIYVRELVDPSRVCGILMSRVVYMFLGNWNIDSSCEISLGYGFCVSRNMGLEKYWKGSIRKTVLEGRIGRTALAGQHWKGNIGRGALEGEHWKGSIGRGALEGQHWKGSIGRAALGRTALEGPHLEDRIGNPPSGKGALG